ncbi:MAG: hypothetical protein JNM48_01870 [Rhodospirillales bacterium]|nr:hypothetical protein [Rhodospirillales bacterium]
MQEPPEPAHLPKDEGPPTLPLPSTWRLIVAACAIVGILYLMYETARKAEGPPEPVPATAIPGKS